MRGTPTENFFRSPEKAGCFESAFRRRRHLFHSAGYLTLLQALLNGGCLRETGILRPETVALMSENQIGNLEVGILKTTNPALSNDVHFFRAFGCDGDLDT
jgi:hypothetical protein